MWETGGGGGRLGGLTGEHCNVGGWFNGVGCRLSAVIQLGWETCACGSE